MLLYKNNNKDYEVTTKNERSLFTNLWLQGFLRFFLAYFVWHLLDNDSKQQVGDDNAQLDKTRPDNAHCTP